MKLLLDQNLSHKLLQALEAHFPGSDHVRRLGLQAATDRAVLDYAAANGFAVVTRDADFLELAQFWDDPPNIIWLRCGNSSTEYVRQLLLGHTDSIRDLEKAADSYCIEILG